MKQATTTPIELIVAIILAAVLIAGSLVFLGLQFRSQSGESSPAFDAEQLKQEMKAEILAEARQQDPQQPAQSQSGDVTPAFDAEQLKQELKVEILEEVQNEKFIDPVIDAGIQRYVRKQQEAQANTRAEQQRLAQEKAKNVRKVNPERDHIYGNPDALITLIEYSDFECPYCKSYHPNPKKVVDDSEGQVNWVYRHYPLTFHNPGAQKQAEASECAAELGGNDAFWKYANTIYERTTSNGKGFPIENLVPLAEELGLDAEKFRECLDSEKYTERVQAELKEGANSGITGTPGTIILNNETGEVRLASGALPASQLQARIQELLPQE